VTLLEVMLSLCHTEHRGESPSPARQFKMRMVAVGVPTGPGLSEECCGLQSLASRPPTPRDDGGASITPASVFHAHLRREALNASSTSPPLVSVATCSSRDMLEAMSIKESERSLTAVRSHQGPFPGKGTVIYLLSLCVRTALLEKAFRLSVW
jgi:hypothetical protein